jgi:hypothetical protein
LGGIGPDAIAAEPFPEEEPCQIKRRDRDGTVYILCRSEGREEKDAAIREKKEEQVHELLARSGE